MVNDDVIGGKGAKAYGGSPASLWLYLDDCDALFNRAVAAGAKVAMPVADMFWAIASGQSMIRSGTAGASPRARRT